MQETRYIKPIAELYQNWFLDYASYVILERAIPSLYDGLKPVQRRVMHSLWELEDGRYNKVANVVGNAMKYHPHGDVSIADAMVQIGQKELLIDTQGNWGNNYTGDRAAAARYIEARLSSFALEVLFNPKITQWQSSYDGRNREPIYLPVKFPILLAQGVEGIAVGLSTKILPHNFNELISSAIAHLKGKKFELYPDFPTSGLIDISQYNDGKRGGRLKIRASIRQKGANQLIIDEIPFGTSTPSLIESIIKANEKGKIKIQKIEDNTADKVEVIIHLSPGSPLQKTIAALYAFTDCEVSISPTACVIDEEKPLFLGVSDILRKTTDHTVFLLKKELEIVLHDTQEAWHFASLERIFINKRIYRKIEEQKTWEGILDSIHEGLAPYTKNLLRKITEEDLIRLTEIRIKRISRFDLDKSEEMIKNLETKIDETKHHLAHLTNYAIEYFTNLRKKYGKNRERKTQIVHFTNINQASVALTNTKVYVNHQEGFIGTSLKKEVFLFECSDLDELIIFRKDGVMIMTRVSEKAFVGKDILHVGLWKKKDERTIYNMIYRDGKKGPFFIKRFAATGLLRDNEYRLTQSSEGSEVLYLSANPNGEAEEVTIDLKGGSRAKKQFFTVHFAPLLIKGKNSKGKLLTKHPIKKISLKSYGNSTLSALKVWFDKETCSLNKEGMGSFLGSFEGTDRLLILSARGIAELVPIELGKSFDQQPLLLEKWHPQKIITCIYFEGEKNSYFVKRFFIDEKTNTKAFFTENHQKSSIYWVSSCSEADVELDFPSLKGEKKASQTIRLSEYVPIKSIKAQGKPLSRIPIKSIKINEFFKDDETSSVKKNEGDLKGKQVSLEL